MDRERLCWMLDFAAALLFALCVGIAALSARAAGQLPADGPAISTAMLLALLVAFVLLRRGETSPQLLFLPPFELAPLEFATVDALELDDALQAPPGDSRVVRLFGPEPSASPSEWTDDDQDPGERMAAALADIREALGYPASLRNR
jgi:hypothetical protein